MYKSKCQVASVDNEQYVDGLCGMIEKYVKEGYEAYIITFLFKFLPLSEQVSKEIMRSEICRVYSRVITEVHRYPNSKRNKKCKPVLICSPDWPIYKRSSKSCFCDIGGTGIHAAGILLLPPFNRLRRGVKDHFETKRNSYIPSGSRLARIHVEHVDVSPGYAAEYTFKSLKRGRSSRDDLLVLPLSGSEG